MYTNIFIEFSAEEVSVMNKSASELLLLPMERVLSAIVDSRMLWYFHTHAVSKMFLCRTMGICIILLLAHLFVSYWRWSGEL